MCRFLMASMVGGHLSRGKLWALAVSMLLFPWEKRRCWSYMGTSWTSDLDVCKWKETKTGRPSKGFSSPWIYKIFLQFTLRMKKKNKANSSQIVYQMVSYHWNKVKTLKGPQTLHFCKVSTWRNSQIYSDGHKNGCIPGTANLTSSTPLGSWTTDADLSKLECNRKAGCSIIFLNSGFAHKFMQLYICTYIY